jgi:methylphosphotriester-DNA--protein-cysteine methyltransferase
MKRHWWKGVAWTVAFLAAAEALWLAARYPTDSDALSQDVQKVIEHHQMRYIGDLTTRQFHRSRCKEAENIPRLSRVLFPSRKAALEMGFMPCPHCQP